MIKTGDTFTFRHRPRVYSKPEYAERDGHLCTVSLVMLDEYRKVLWRRVKFADGKQAYVFEEELEAGPAAIEMAEAAD